MKAVICEGQGGPEVLKIREFERPKLGVDQVRIAVKACGVNRADTVQRKGFYPPPPGASPILGLEAAGLVTETQSSKWKIGDKVMALLAGGGYAEEVTVDGTQLMAIPGSYTWEEAAATVEVFLTAHHNLFHLGGAAPGKRVLIHAGASGVGSAGIQLLREIGVQPFVTVSSEEKASFCRKLGSQPIIYKTEDFAARINEMTEGKGVDVLLDCIGASYLEKNLSSLAVEGRLILIGLMGGTDASLSLNTVLRKRIRIIGSTLRALPLPEKAAIIDRFLRQFGPALQSRKILSPIDKVFNFEEVADAHRYMESNANSGKIVLKL